jgi:viologen exporter family transport system permease protein
MNLVRFVAHYVRANFQIALEYRVSFWAQVFAMVVNDAMWIAFWGLFFKRFPVVRGYGFDEVVLLWAVAAMGFGLTAGLCGNAWRFGAQVAQGELDFYLVLPKPVLLHLVVSGMSVSAWGDVLFALGLFGALVRPGPGLLARFLVLAATSATIMTAYAVVVNWLAFWLGQSEGLAREFVSALLIFSTYPSTLFNGAVKVLLFTAVPAGFVAYVPVELLRSRGWSRAALMAGAAGVAVTLAVVVFGAGLRRYESGNLLAMRA